MTDKFFAWSNTHFASPAQRRNVLLILCPLYRATWELESGFEFLTEWQWLLTTGVRRQTVRY